MSTSGGSSATATTSHEHFSPAIKDRHAPVASNSECRYEARPARGPEQPPGRCSLGAAKE
eukprot:5899611-Prymnesium_polylepis.1